MKCRGSLVKPKHITRPFYFIFIFYFFKIIICRIYISQISNDDAGHNVSSSFSPKLFRFFYFSGRLTCPSRRATIVNRLSHLRNVFLCVCVWQESAKYDRPVRPSFSRVRSFRLLSPIVFFFCFLSFLLRLIPALFSSSFEWRQK